MCNFGDPGSTRGHHLSVRCVPEYNGLICRARLITTNNLSTAAAKRSSRIFLLVYGIVLELNAWALY